MMTINRESCPCRKLTALPSVTTYDVPGEIPQRRLIQFAMRFELSACDAAYLELADRLQALLHTEDKAMRKAAAKLSLLP